MSLNSSKKEFIFNLILMQNPSLLSQFIGGDYQHSELELYQNRLYIDMYGRKRQNNVPVFVETQLNRSDAKHFDKVKQLIGSIEDGIIVWIATEFKTNYLEEMYNLLHFSIAKPINLYMVVVEDSYMSILEELNKKDQIHVWNRLNQQQIELPVLSIVESIEIIPSGYQAKAEEYLADAISTIKGANKYFLRCLKKKVPFFFNAYRAKANPEKRQIVLGAGRAGLDYVVCLETLKGDCYLKLRLTNERHQQLFNRIKERFMCESNYANMEYRSKEVIFYFSDIKDTIQKIQAVINQFEQVIIQVDSMVYKDYTKTYV